MHDIFLSYSSKDRERLVPLVNALEAQGWTVFWDHRSIKVAQEWHKVIGTAIQQCPCVIVAWSVNAVASRWVTEEALIARDRGVLYPIMLDQVAMPFGFNLIQSADFVGWDGEIDHPEFVELKEQLSIRLGLKPVQPQDKIPISEPLPLISKPTPSLGFSWVKLVSGTGLLAAVGLGGYQFLQTEDGNSVEPLTPPAAPAVVQQPEPAKPKPPVIQNLPEMVEIPEGSFIMGCDDKKEKGCQDDEKPPHKVEIKKFLLAKTEVTVSQFREFADSTNYQTTAEKEGSCWSYDDKGKWNDVKGNSWKKLGFEQGDNHPVACVSYNDATAYVSWLSEKTDKEWRLPSEAEWEYAARAGTATTYSWGEEADKGCQFVNMADKKAKTVHTEWTIADCDDGYIYTAPTGSFTINSFGLYHMYGNVWEWVEDKWHSDYQNAPTDGSAWLSGDSSGRVLRGGSWGDGPQFLRSASRSRNTPVNRSSLIGFRPAQVYEPKSK